ncbi:MAG: 23S rRNA (uracil(1939)-C(5))-methyltransferase RlmD [Desulfobacteraceae bacterium 4572_19]|nr:MAG: 23S rRNA (uracil(1939)-C(5))-methyltransferase RlmD [Desulfobacteraceae bacterium 4572_19]
MIQNLKKGQIIELIVSDIAFGGRGFAKIDGFAVFIDKAVTGDTVEVRIVKRKKNYAEARILKMIKPSEDRIKPRCNYSEYCGGCKWQFLDYEKQLYYKTKQVAESLEHIGLVKDVNVHPAIPSDSIFGYRNKMEFSCSDKRWLLPEELDTDAVKGFGLGLHVPGTFDKILDIDKCHIQPELGNDILNDIRKFIINSNLPVYGLRSHEGFWRFIMLRHSFAHNKWMVNIVTAWEEKAVLKELADILMEKYSNIVSIVNNVTSKRAGIAVGEYELVIAGDSFIKDMLGKYEFKISANSFFQTNTAGAEKLYSTVKEYAALTGNETVLDLYSGTGTIPIWLSEYAKEITGIEIVESSIADAKKNALHNGVNNCNFLLGDIKEILPQLYGKSEVVPNRIKSDVIKPDSVKPNTVKPDVIIIDPPRMGMHKDVVKQVAKLAVPKIVYVSCNPATLARDIEMLKNDYRVIEIQPVDMFPHTYHIEAVAKLEKI